MAGRLLRLMFCILALVLVMPPGLQAANVGHFVQVEGQVDLLKGGKLPVTTAKVKEAVDQGDVVRTKKNSRAQIQFVDETVLTVAPSSRVAIEDYVYDAANGKRSATIEIFRGLVHTLVKKIYQVEEPDFVVKTHTSVLGVRGTDWYTQLLPTSTDVYTQEVGEVTKLNPEPNPKAGLEAKNIFPEIKGKVLLKAMQFTRVGVDLPPTLPVNITKEDLKYLQTWMNIESGGSSPRSETPESSATSSQTAPTGGLSTIPTTTSTAGSSLVSPTYLPRTTNLESPTQYLASGLYVPPQPTSSPPPSPPSPPSPPQPQTFYFTQSWFGTFVFQSEYPFTQGSVQGWGWGQRTGVYDGYYSANYSHLRYPTSGGSFSTTFLPGTSTGTMEGSVTGIRGETLTGTMTFTGSLAIGGTFDYSGNVTLEPSGAMIYNYSGTRTNRDGGSGGTAENGVMNFFPGTYFKQTVASFSVQEVSFAPYYSATYSSVGPVSGTREGYSPGTFHGSFSTTAYSGQLNDYSNKIETGTLTMEGVLSGSPDGTMTGAMTTTARALPTDESPDVLGGPVMAYPDGTMVAELYSSRHKVDGIHEVEQGMWVQTSDPNATTFATRFVGSTDGLVTSPPYNTGTYTGRGFGFGEAAGIGGGYYVGTLSGTITGPDNSFTPPNDPSDFSFTIAGVARQTTSEGPLTGVVFANGRIANNLWVYADVTPGTFTLQPDNTATLTLKNLIKGAPLIIGTLTSTINTTPGIFFDQVAGPGSVTYTTTPPSNNQFAQLTDGIPITNGTGTLGNFIVSGFSGISDPDIPVFPPLVVSPNTRIYTHGVIGVEGTGAMQLTVVDSAGWYRLRGAALQTSGPNLQGINLVQTTNVGPNLVPTKRNFQYQQQASE